MDLIAWNTGMSVGIESIDLQHKKLVSILNELYNASESGHGRESVGKTLDALHDYTLEHFQHEEDLFAQTGYPETASHILEHKNLARELAAIQEKYKAGSTDALTRETLNFLVNWLLNHTMSCDKLYAEHLQTHGIH